MPKYLRVLVVVGALAFSASPASAGSQSSGVSITASIAQACTTLTPSSSAITFPAYDSFGNASTPDDATVVQFTTQCTKGASNVNFSVSGGLNCTHATGLRSMKTPGNAFLNYNLYEESTHSTVWPFNTSTCAASPGPTLTINSTTDTQTLSLYGRIPSGQDPTVGNNYTDTVTVAVNF
jgi:spore coat protein U-like protein